MPSTASDGAAVPDRVRFPTTPTPRRRGRRPDRPRLPAVRRHRRRAAGRAPGAARRNAVRLEFSAEPDPHAAAAATLAAWLADGTLSRRYEPAAYYYRHATPSAPDELDRRGRGRAGPARAMGRRDRPHEHTMPGPKADRLALLHATRTQLSPILTVYFDRSERYRHVMSRAWTDEWRARDGDGMLHQLAAIEADDRLLGYLGRQTLFVADGHHRYETALAYQAEVRCRPALRRAPAGLAGGRLDHDDARQRRAHRARDPADPSAAARRGRRCAARPGGWRRPAVRGGPVAPDDLARRWRSAATTTSRPSACVLPGDEGYLLVGDPDGLADRLRRER